MKDPTGEGAFTTVMGEPMVKNPGLFEIAAKALGFQPSRLSRAYSREASEKVLKRMSMDKSEYFYRAIAKAIKSRDQEEMKRIYREIAEHNATASPHEIVNIATDDAQNAIERHYMMMTFPEMMEMRQLPVKARPRYQKLQEVYR
jgi:cobalamin biosynthesis protein CbiD